MVLYSEFTYGSQFSEEKNDLEIRSLFPKILNNYKRSIFLGTPCMRNNVQSEILTGLSGCLIKLHVVRLIEEQFDSHSILFESKGQIFKVQALQIIAQYSYNPTPRSQLR